MVKKFDKKNVLKNFIIFIHILITGGAVYFITTPFVWKSFFINVFIYSAITGYAYDIIKNKALQNLGKKVKDTVITS